MSGWTVLFILLGIAVLIVVGILIGAANKSRVKSAKEAIRGKEDQVGGGKKKQQTDPKPTA